MSAINSQTEGHLTDNSGHMGPVGHRSLYPLLKHVCPKNKVCSWCLAVEGDSSVAVMSVFWTLLWYYRQTFKVKLIILQLNKAATP